MSYFQFYNDIPVINYHKVSSKKEIGLSVVSIGAFEAQMKYLKSKGYQTIASTEYENTTIEKPIIISFDDAYSDVYDSCLPVMEELGFKGLVFPIVNFIGKENSWDANLAGVTFRHMDKDQLCDLANYGWEIGSHSLNHISFLHAKNIKEEIYDSKKKLEDLISKSIKCFSYPFGRVTNTVKLLVERVYDYAFLAKMVKKVSPIEISRFSVYSTDDINTFSSKLDNRFFKLLKGNLIHKGAIATELYQLFFRNKVYK
jgi:peptidoglycan/xylan/chitin deacetylase (PgdA/CDA1 family)